MEYYIVKLSMVDHSEFVIPLLFKSKVRAEFYTQGEIYKHQIETMRNDVMNVEIKSMPVLLEN